MGSFNSFGQKKLAGYGSTPVWLGVVSPKPVGGVLASAFAQAGAFFAAGHPICLSGKTITPLMGYKVVKVTTSGDNKVIDVAPMYGFEAEPTTSIFLMKMGAKFDTTAKAWNPDSVAASTETGAKWAITVAAANIDVPSVGDYLVISSATAEGSSKSMANQPNAYLYNDICIEALQSGESYVSGSVAASGAAVDFHAEGILIENTPAYIVKSQMKSAVANVAQIEY